MARVAETIAKAFDDLYYLERACHAQYLVQSARQPLRIVGEEIARQAAKQFGADLRLAADHLEAIKRVLDAEEPEYVD